MSTVLAEGLLDGVGVCVAFEDAGPVTGRLADLGASVTTWTAAPGADEADDVAAVEAAKALDGAGVLVVDALSRFRSFEGGVVERLRAAVDGSFVVLRAVTDELWIKPGVPGGKVILVAPSAGDGEYAAACGAALENTARTLSVEWARYGVRVVAIVPRAGSQSGDVAELVGFVASLGGDYYSGCVLRPGGE